MRAVASLGLLITVIAGCDPVGDEIRATRRIDVTPGVPVHVVATMSAATVAQADEGFRLAMDVSCEPRGIGVSVELVADDAALDPLVMVASAGGGAAIQHRGDVATICPASGDCVVGATLTVSGTSPCRADVEASARSSESGGWLTGGGFHDGETLTLTIE